MLEKNIFRTTIKEILLSYMLENKYKAGDRLSLPTIAEHLTVSVTPIREALTQLTETGIVTYKANRGFFVTELTKQEAVEIYELISLLEAEAIRRSSFTKEQLRDLAEINKKFKTSTNSHDKLYQDRNFHQKLIEGYSNGYAKKIIEDIRIRIYLYEYEFMASNNQVNSASMHDRIIKLLKADKKAQAAKELELNWKTSIDHILRNYNNSSDA